jgi:hypothetical protein
MSEILILRIVLGIVYVIGLAASLFIAGDQDDEYAFWEAISVFFSCLVWPLVIVYVFGYLVYDYIGNYIYDRKVHKLRKYEQLRANEAATAPNAKRSI